MLKTIGLIVVLILAIVLTIAVCLVLLFLICAGVYLAWRAFERMRIPEQERRVQEYQTLVKNNPAFHSRQAHEGAVFALASHPDSLCVASGGQDGVRLFDTQWNEETAYATPFTASLLCAGEQEEMGLRIAAASAYEQVPNGPAVLVWNVSSDNADTPPTELFVPNVCRIHGIAWDDTACTLRVFAGVFDAARPVAPNDDTNTANQLVLLQWNLEPETNRSADPPQSLPLPTEFDALETWEMQERDNFALSQNGLFLACRTQYTGPEGTGKTGHGIGVWSLSEGRWHNRFGGREAQPHKIYAVSGDGQTVYSARGDDPGRDYKYGGPEWWDGLYVWNAQNTAPEGAEEARPDTGPLTGSRSMAFNRDETLMANPTVGGDVEIYDLQTKTLRQTVSRPQPNDDNRYGNNVWCCAFCGEDRTLATGHADGQVWFWTVSMPA